MEKLYMGIDIGSFATKIVVIDEYKNIITSSCEETNGNPIETVKTVIEKIIKDIDFNNYRIVSVGTTGSARKLIGTMLGASTINNEITANVVGTTSIYPNVRTIFEMGAEDSKIILINDGIVVDYAINTSCSAGSGYFISSLFKKLHIDLDDVSKVAIESKNAIDISNRCAVFLLSDVVHKIQLGYPKKDIINGLCKSIAVNYINTVAKGKKIIFPIVFNGGLSKNKGIVMALENIINEQIIVDKNSNLIGALGAAVLAMQSGKESDFDFDIEKLNIETKIIECNKCNNNCEMVAVYRNNQLIDYWGNKCDNGEVSKKIVKKSNLVV